MGICCACTRWGSASVEVHRAAELGMYVEKSSPKIDAEMFISSQGSLVKSADTGRLPAVSGGGVNRTMRALRPRMKC
jgi:hypothetical protein